MQPGTQATRLRATSLFDQTIHISIHVLVLESRHFQQQKRQPYDPLSADNSQEAAPQVQEAFASRAI